MKKIGQFEKEEEETESTVLQGDFFKEIYVKDVAWKRISEYFVCSKWAVCVRV